MSQMRELLQQLHPDHWRESNGFSPGLARATADLVEGEVSDYEKSLVLREWLKTSQPCVFGRIAAGNADLLSFCFIDEHDIRLGDEHVKNKIQRHRLDWKRRAFTGDRSGFVVLAVSRRLSEAVPNQATTAFAIRLATLYLLEEVETDKIHHERITIERQTPSGPEWYEWKAGVNIFSAQADNRWWADHRIPGGLGFSVNSVGHMVTSQKALASLAAEAQQLARRGHSIDSLDVALRFAMITINNAAGTASGRATELVNQGPGECPAHAGTIGPLAGKSCQRYAG